MQKIFIAACLLLPLFGHAQTDTVFTKITTETGEFEAPQVVTESDRLFGTKVPSRWMLKLTGNPTSVQNVETGVLTIEKTPFIQAGVEYKLGPAFSIGANASIASRAILVIGETQAFSYAAALEQRWYHNMRARVKAGKSANNFTGAYVGLSESVTFDRGSQILRDERANYGLSLRYGYQSRFMRYGFFDFSAGLGVSYLSKSIFHNASMGFSFDQRFRIGFAVFEQRKKEDFSGGYCQILRCFDEERRMWKVNLFDAVRVSITPGINNLRYFSLAPSIAYEQKIGQSSFSVETSAGINLDMLYLQYRDNLGTLTTARLSTISGLLGAELRCYAAQKRRIATGKGGNNLRGVFFALSANGRYGTSLLEEEPPQSNSNFFQAGSHVLWGYQMRISKHGYVQFKGGPGVQLYNYTDNKWSSNFSMLANVQVGFAF
jgi:Protein of unknown function (DUF3575)